MHTNFSGSRIGLFFLLTSAQYGIKSMWVFVSYGFQLHEPFQCEELIEHATIFMFPVYLSIWNCTVCLSSSAQEAKDSLVMTYKPTIDTDQIIIAIVVVVIFVIIIIISLFFKIWLIV